MMRASQQLTREKGRGDEKDPLFVAPGFTTRNIRYKKCMHSSCLTYSTMGTPFIPLLVYMMNDSGMCCARRILYSIRGAPVHG